MSQYKCKRHEDTNTYREKDLNGLRWRNAVGADGERAFGDGEGGPWGLDNGETARDTRATGRMEGLVACGDGHDVLVDKVEAGGRRGLVGIEEGAFGRDVVGERGGDAVGGGAIEFVIKEGEGVGAAELAQGGLGANLWKGSGSLSREETPCAVGGGGYLIVLGGQRHEGKDIGIGLGGGARAHGGGRGQDEVL
jgi:hypothetical protein